jgi:hypothetical protein
MAAPEAVEMTDKPNGPVAAVLLATGIGGFVLAVLTIWAEASTGFKESLEYDLEVGPLSGKTIWATVAFLGSWAILGLALRRREVDLRKAGILAAFLIALSLVGTFSLFFELFTAEE